MILFNFQNFGIDNPQDLITKLDEVILGIIDPLVLAVDDMLFLMSAITDTLFTGGGLFSFIGNLIDATINIDVQIRDMRAAVKEYNEEACQYVSLLL